MRRTLTNIASGAAAAALLFSSTAGIAATQPAAAPRVDSPWLALSMMSPAGAAALGDTAAVAGAQPMPPYQEQSSGGLPPPPIPVIAVWLATLLVIIYF